MKRGRNQRRRPGNNPNRALDSNGPDVRIRGTANQIYDKYQALARDASSSGDRIKAESYLQHAEHYFRLIRANQANQQQQQQTQADGEAEQPTVAGDEQPEAPKENGAREPRRGRGRRNSNAAAADAEAVESATETEAKSVDEPAEEAAAPAEEEPKPRRRRATRKKAVKKADAEEAKTEEPVAAE